MTPSWSCKIPDKYKKQVRSFFTDLQERIKYRRFLRSLKSVPVRGVKVLTWDEWGKGEYVWTDNPVWILADICRRAGQPLDTTCEGIRSIYRAAMACEELVCNISITDRKIEKY
jgi:hypothetical protein